MWKVTVISPQSLNQRSIFFPFDKLPDKLKNITQGSTCTVFFPTPRFTYKLEVAPCI